MPPITRSLRFEVCFPGARKADLITGEGKNIHGLWPDLWRAMDDLTRAANITISGLFQVRIGTIPRPQKEDGKGVSDQTLAYQGFSGKWRPSGVHAYPAREGVKRVSGAVMAETANAVHTRLSTDFVAVRNGAQALPTFRRLPLHFPSRSVEIKPNLDISVGIWGVPEGATSRRVPAPVLVRAVRLDASQKAILRRLQAGEEGWSAGSGKLAWVQPKGRSGKWVLSLSWTGPVAAATGDLIAGVHLGIDTAVTMAYVRQGATPSPQRLEDRIHFPGNLFRARRRLEGSRIERLHTNVKPGQRRAFRGRGRKISVDVIGSRISRLVGTTVEEIAAETVRRAKARGASVLAVPDIRGLTGAVLDRTEALPGPRRAEARKAFLRHNIGTLRLQILSVAEREGLRVIQVPAAGLSSTCPTCGVKLAKDPGSKGPAPLALLCSCGAKTPRAKASSLNAALRANSQIQADLAKSTPADPVPGSPV